MKLSAFLELIFKFLFKIASTQFYLTYIIVENYLCGLIMPGKIIPYTKFIKLAQKHAGTKIRTDTVELLSIKGKRYYLTTDKGKLNKHALNYFILLCLLYIDKELFNPFNNIYGKKSESIQSLQEEFFNYSAGEFLSLPDKLHFHPGEIAVNDRELIDKLNNFFKEKKIQEIDEEKRRLMKIHFVIYLKTEQLRAYNIHRLLIDIIKGKITVKNEITNYLRYGFGNSIDWNFIFLYDNYGEFIRQEENKCYINGDIYTNNHLLCKAFFMSMADNFLDKNAAGVFAVNLI